MNNAGQRPSSKTGSPRSSWLWSPENEGKIIGPVQQEAKFERSQLVAELRKELGASADKIVSETYTRIKRFSTKVDAENIDSLVAGMSKLWSDFGASEQLRRIDKIVKEIVR